MKLNSAFFALLFVFFVSCGKTTTTPTPTKPTKPPVVVTNDPELI